MEETLAEARSDAVVRLPETSSPVNCQRKFGGFWGVEVEEEVVDLLREEDEDGEAARRRQ